MPRGRVPRERFDDMLAGPGRGWHFSDIEVQDCASGVVQDQEDEEHLKGAVGTVKKSIETLSQA